MNKRGTGRVGGMIEGRIDNGVSKASVLEAKKMGADKGSPGSINLKSPSVVNGWN